MPREPRRPAHEDGISGPETNHHRHDMAASSTGSVSPGCFAATVTVAANDENAITAQTQTHQPAITLLGDIPMRPQRVGRAVDVDDGGVGGGHGGEEGGDESG
jgi:hypothetical protein